MCKVTQIMYYSPLIYDPSEQSLIVFRNGKHHTYKHTQKRYDRLYRLFKNEYGKVSTYSAKRGFFVSQELPRTIQQDLYRFKL